MRCPVSAAGRGFSPPGGPARHRSPKGGREANAGSARAVSAAAQSRSYGVGSSAFALRLEPDPRLTTRPAPSQGLSAVQAEPNVGAGFEPATRCVNGICSTHLSYPSSWWDLPESNRRLRADWPGALPQSFRSLLRSAEHDTAVRHAPAGTSARTQVQPKARGFSCCAAA